MEGGPGGLDGPSTSGGGSSTDPRLVEKMVEELKSQGIFDQIRNDCLAEVDTKPAYQNLRQRVESSVSRYLTKQNSNWKPTQNKNQLRNQLRRHIQESNYLDAGVERIVDQVVNPKILSSIEPEVEAIIYNYLGVEKPEEGKSESEDLEKEVHSNGNHGNKKNEEKLSNISSEDIEMRSAVGSSGEDEAAKASDASSPGPGLRGDISPLTPERKTSSVEPQGDVSPLTPPPPGTTNSPLPPLPRPMMMAPPPPPRRLPSPQTPPLPPPMEEVVEEEVVQEMSPVSDTELTDISPPRKGSSPETPDDSGMPSPPPPPLPRDEAGGTPPLPAPPPPLPPPPSSSSKASKASPLTSPINSSSDEMEASKKKSVSASDISDTDLPAGSQSEKESSDDLEELEKARAELQAKLAAANLDDEDQEEEEEEDNSMSPISDDESPKDKHDDDDDHPEGSSKDLGGDGQGSPDESGPPPDKESGSGSADSGQDKKDQSEPKDGEAKKQHKSSSKHKSHRHHHHHHSHHHSSSSSGKKQKRRDKDRKQEDEKKEKEKKEKELKKFKEEKSKKSKAKLEEIEAKVKENFTLKSDKFKAFDMFAPKTPKAASKPFSPPTIQRPPLPSPPVFSSPKSTTPMSKSKPTSLHSSGTPRRSSTEVKASKLERRTSTEPSVKESKESFIVHEQQRKVFPELPVPKTEGIDKLKQHEDDILETKRRLEVARQKRMLELQRQKEAKKRKKSSTSTTSPKSDLPTSLEVPEIKRYNSEEPEEPKKRALSGDDEEEDNSDDEWRRRKQANNKKSRRRYSSSSDDDEENQMRSHLVTTRKTAQKSQADAILNDGDWKEHFSGFQDDELLLDNKNLLEEYLNRDLDEVQVPEVTVEELDKDPNDFIYIDGLQDFRGGAVRVAEKLKAFGGHPKVVKAIPQWLAVKLSQWNLARHQVEIVTEAAKVRKRRIITEQEYDVKCGVKHNDDESPKAMSQARVVIELDDIEEALERMNNERTSGSSSPDEQEEKEQERTKELTQTEETFRGFSNQDLDVIKEQMKKAHEDALDTLDLNGNTFGMEWVDAEDTNMATPDEEDTLFFQVSMSNALIAHLKDVLRSDTAALSVLEGISATKKAPTDYPLPPSPISCPSSDSSDKGSTSPAAAARQPASTPAPRRGRPRRSKVV